MRVFVELRPAVWFWFLSRFEIRAVGPRRNDLAGPFVSCVPKGHYWRRLLVADCLYALFSVWTRSPRREHGPAQREEFHASSLWKIQPWELPVSPWTWYGGARPRHPPGFAYERWGSGFFVVLAYVERRVALNQPKDRSRCVRMCFLLKSWETRL